MPIIRSISSGNIIHKPVMKALYYYNFYNYISPGQVGQQNVDININTPSIGPDRRLYIGVYSTRSGAGAEFQAPTFNGRVMTQLATVGAGPVIPILWYWVPLLNNETSGTFRWRENAAQVVSVGIQVWIARGMRSTGAYSSAGVTAAGSSNGAFINQRTELTLVHPPGELSFVLTWGIKGRAVSGDTSNYNGSNHASIMHTNDIFLGSAGNNVNMVHGYTNLYNGNSTDYSTNYFIQWISNSLPISMMAGIVIY